MHKILNLKIINQWLTNKTGMTNLINNNNKDINKTSMKLHKIMIIMIKNMKNINKSIIKIKIFKIKMKNTINSKWLNKKIFNSISNKKKVILNMDMC